MTENEFRQLIQRIDHVFHPLQIGSVGDDWILAGNPRNGYQVDDLQRLLDREDVPYQLRRYDDRLQIRFTTPRDVVLRLPKIPPLNIILFLLTVATTLLAGSLMENGNHFSNPADLLRGLPFSLTLLLILGTHEAGHYYFARKHQVDTTLPYFIPAPTLIGTFGAFIKIKSPIYQRTALLQIGAAGPIAGFIVAVPAMLIGLTRSTVVTSIDDVGGIMLGDSLLMKLMIVLTHPGLTDNQDLLLHPVAFAAWIGMLVTMLNLLPIGQLDGGHIAYAMLGDRHGRLAWGALAALIPLSFFSLNWLVWGALILILMRTAKHPPIMDIQQPLSSRDRKIGLVSLVIFILCFIPVPFG